MPVNEAEIFPENPDLCRVIAPAMDAMDLEVQHPIGKGPPADGKGVLGFSVVTMPTGQPRIIIQMRHPDGTALAGIIKTAGDMQTLREALNDADFKAQQMSDAVKAAPRQ